MKLSRIIAMGFLTMLLSSCMSAEYINPTHSDEKERYTLEVNKPFVQVWKQLIEYSTTSFFAIDNCENDSGLINLSFGASKPPEFVTGGHWKSSGSGSFQGDYVDYLSKDWNRKLVGKLNILVSRVSENKTRIRISLDIYLLPIPENQVNH